MISSGEALQLLRKWQSEKFPKCHFHQRRFQRIRRFCFACSCIQIAKKSWHWENALFQPAIEPFESFLPKIANIVRCNNRLDISRKPAGRRA